MGVRVPVYGAPLKSVLVDHGATKGATIGRDVWNADGTLFVPGAIATPAPGEASGVVIWRRVLEIPVNVTAVAALAADGFVRKAGDVWSASAIVNADLAGADTDGLAEGATNRYFTDERAQDAAGAAIAAGASDGVLLSYDDAGNAIDAANTDKGSVAVAAHVAEADPHPQYLTGAEASGAYAPLSHVGAGGAAHANAVAAGAAGFLTGADKAKLDGVAAGATAYTDTLARAAIIAASIADADTTHAPSGDAVFDALALKAAIPKGYIDGLQMQWVSGTALTVTSGSANIEASGNIVASPTAIAKSSLSLSASTWYHVYLYLNAGTPDIEIVTTAPVVYDGTARSKTGDASRRYVGSVLTNASSNLYNFVAGAGGAINYNESASNAPFRLIVNGTATTKTTISAAAVIPVTSRQALIRISNNGTAVLSIGNPSDGLSAYPLIVSVAPGAFLGAPFLADASQAISYVNNAAGGPGGIVADLFGYIYER